MQNDYPSSSESSDLLTLQGQIIYALNCCVLSYNLHDHNVIVVNDTLKRIYGLSGADSNTLGRAVIKSIIPEDADAVREITKKLVHSGDSVNYIYRISKPNGEIATLKAFTTRQAFLDGREYILSVIENISVEEGLRVSLNRERQLYRDALTRGVDCCFTFDVTEGIITEPVLVRGKDILPALGLSLPVKYDELGRRFFEKYNIQLSDESMQECYSCSGLKRLYESGIFSAEAECFVPCFGTYFSALVAISMDEKNGHLYALYFSRDTTELRNREEQRRNELKAAYDAASRASEAKTNFLASMSHDIRTPMNAIIGMTAIAGTHLDDRERVADCLAKITTSSKHLLGLINEVLDMNKIESGKLDLYKEEFNLSDLIDNLLTMIRPQVDARHHELLVNIYNVEHEHVVGDSQRIQQVFMNIMSNAVKYTPDHGQIKLFIREKPTNHERIGCYEFVFEDNGIGMKEDFIPHIFEAFSRAKDTVVEKMQGTGLGMAITNNIVHMMNGDIKVESKLGLGSKFTVTIYLELQNVNETTDLEQFVNLPVLVVDDDKSSCEAACGILRELGMHSEWVLSGSEAIDLVLRRHEEENDFLAVIIDWKMPEMDGLATTREIRKRVSCNIPIIIISAYDWSDIEAEARAAGVNAFLSKPVFKSRVIRAFRTLLCDSEETESRFDLKDFSLEDFSDRRALLVEDNLINAEIAGEILGMTGLKVEYAYNGKEAVDRIAEAEDDYYDIVFMDIQMPIMNGYEAARAIRSMSSNYAKRVPILAVTANAFAEDIQEVRNAGMNEHISKPLNFEELLRVLKRWLSQEAMAPFTEYSKTMRERIL